MTKTKKKQSRKPIEKKYGVDFKAPPYLSLTLRTEDLGTHASGWTVTGAVVEDWYEWVEDFEAVHPKLGKVWGDFEGTVYATSERAFKHFYDNHPPQPWDKGDI